MAKSYGLLTNKKINTTSREWPCDDPCSSPYGASFLLKSVGRFSLCREKRKEKRKKTTAAEPANRPADPSTGQSAG